MPEQESNVPQSDRDFKVKEGSEQVGEKTPEGVLDRARNWLEKRRQIREAYETNKDYDSLFERFIAKEEKVFTDVIDADGVGAWLNEGIDKGKIDSLISELRSSIEEIGQFEREKLGMSSDSSKLREMIELVDNDEEDFISVLNNR